MGLLQGRTCRLCPRAAKHQLDATKSGKGICLIGGAQIARGHEGRLPVSGRGDVRCSSPPLTPQLLRLLFNQCTMASHQTWWWKKCINARALQVIVFTLVTGLRGSDRGFTLEGRVDKNKCFLSCEKQRPHQEVGAEVWKGRADMATAASDVQQNITLSK